MLLFIADNIPKKRPKTIAIIIADSAKTNVLGRVFPMISVTDKPFF